MTHVLDMISLGLTVITAVEFVAFLVVYTKLNRWWHEPFGKAFGSLMAIVTAFLVLAVVSRSTQGWAGWPYFRVGMWALLAGGAGYLLYAFLKTRAVDRRRVRQEG